MAFNSIGLGASFATLAAHFVGMIISMYFTMDFWFRRIYGKSAVQTNSVARGKFLLIACIAAFISWIFSRVFFPSGHAESFSLIVLNWACLASISVFKYFTLLAVLLPPRFRTK